jgi:hypothetical protein
MIFTIEKGKHSSDQWVHKLLNWKGKAFHYLVCFEDNCQYDIGMPDQLDVNKLIGFSLSSNHHDNSVRFGWRSHGDNIVIYSYSYTQGSRIVKEIGSVKLGEEFVVYLRQEGKDFVYGFHTQNAKPREFRLKMPDNVRPTYMLWPYFGGNQTAPHRMKISLSQLAR